MSAWRVASEETTATVLVAARDPDRGRAAAEDLGAVFVVLDVTDDASYAHALPDRPR